MKRAPLSLRVFAVNATVLCMAALVLALSPATVSVPVTEEEALTIVAGLTAMLLLNLWLVRRAFGPLAQLSEHMRRVDLLRPAPRLSTEGQDQDVATLTDALNGMLDRLEVERRENARRALHAQEAERLRVARELHDEVGQTLTGLLLQVDGAMREAPARARGQLEEVRAAARESLHEVRRIAQRLRPEALDDLGLSSALTALATRFAEHSDVHVVRGLEGSLPALAPEAELAVYRIAQEGPDQRRPPCRGPDCRAAPAPGRGRAVPHRARRRARHRRRQHAPRVGRAARHARASAAGGRRAGRGDGARRRHRGPARRAGPGVNRCPRR